MIEITKHSPATLSDISIQLHNYRKYLISESTCQQLNAFKACRHNEDELLKFRPGIRMERKG